MQIIRNRVLSADHWRHELDSPQQLNTREIPPGDIVVTLERWRNDWEQLLARGTKIAVRLDACEDLSVLLDTEYHELWMIELVFDSFTEGRGYSHAHLLRERYGFLGDLRAIGDVSQDRIAFMERCGVNEFVLSANADQDQALEAFDEISLRYQPMLGSNPVIAGLRGYRNAASV